MADEDVKAESPSERYWRAKHEEAEKRIKKLEIHANMLYRGLLRTKVEAKHAEETIGHAHSDSEARVSFALTQIVTRGWRRSQKDPVYKAIREQIQETAAAHGGGAGVAVEVLTQDDVEAVLEDHPEFADRAWDIAYEFGVDKPAPKEGREEEEAGEDDT